MTARSWAVSLLVGISALFWAGTSTAVDVSVEPPFTFVASGQSASVFVDANGIGSEGLAAFQVELSFDPAIFAASDPNAATSAQPFEPAAWLLTSTGRVPVGVVSVDNVVGRVVIAYATEPGPAHATGSGPLVEIVLTAIGTGVSALSIDAAIVADGSIPPQSLPVAIFDASISSDPAVGDQDGDQIPENADGLGLPGDVPCTGGATAGCDDNCPLLANTSQDDLDSNGLGDACQDAWTFSGVAAGGSVAFDIEGIMLMVVTLSGESAAQVASNIAAAINADATLAALGIRGLANGNDVIANAPIVGRTINDAGLEPPAVPIPFGVAVTQTLVLLGSGFAVLRRRLATARRDPRQEEA